MTRREWLVEHVPENVMKIYGGSAESEFEGGCCFCPEFYPDMPGAEDLCESDCEACWTREVPVTGEAETAEIISDLKDID